MKLYKEEIVALEKKYRLNLINSVSGIKPANLIGTKSLDGKDNVAIFSSVVHLGSNPAQFGLIVRPAGEVRRDTYNNILDTGFYTINHVSEAFIKNAHYTSAKIDKDISEFDLMNIEKELIEDFHAPFVKSSGVKLGMKHVEDIPLPNGCTFVIGEVEMIICPDDSLNELGQLDLASYSAVGISGLNTYYALKKLETFPYVRENEIPNFE